MCAHCFAKSTFKMSKSMLNQPIWESSQRLLHPKCIWIESIRGASNGGGHRHFIFDHSLTHTDRIRSDSVSLGSGHRTNRTTRIEKSQSCDTVETKLDGLSIVGAGDRIQNARSLNSLNDRSELNAEICFENEFYNTHDLPKNTGESVTPINDISNDDNPIASSMKRISSEIDSSKNLLAERVLQWLDLAGGLGHSSTRRNEHMGKTLNASKRRRSVTAKEQRKICAELPEDAEMKSKLLLHRRKPLHQLSMTFNDVLNVQDLSTRNFFGDLFPTTYKCSRKFLTLRRPKNAFDSLEPLDLQLSLPIKSMVKKSHGKMKSKRPEYCDDQYRSMIQRGILETSCNAQVAKRQLHIFMPNFPKRCLIVNDCDANATHSMSPKSIQSADNQSSRLSYRLAST